MFCANSLALKSRFLLLFFPTAPLIYVCLSFDLQRLDLDEDAQISASVDTSRINPSLSAAVRYGTDTPSELDDGSCSAAAGAPGAKPEVSYARTAC